MRDWLNGTAPLTPDRDHKSSQDWALDHPMEGLAGPSNLSACEDASIKALNAATSCTGQEFDWLLDDDQFDQARIDVEDWGDAK